MRAASFLRLSSIASIILLSVTLLVGRADRADASHPLGFTAVPGPNIRWQIPDPSFQPLAGARVFSGVHFGAAYRIEVPANWNGELVIYAHGYRGSPPELTVSNPPIREHLINNGFAWAASSYASNGYVPGIGAQDSLNLKSLFATLVGKPARTYLYGTSMGGHVGMISAEFFPRAYDGVLSECGVVGGVELFDFFAASAAAAEYITGANYTSGRALETTKIASALGVGSALTTQGRQVANVMINLSGGPRPFAQEGLAQFLVTDIGAGAPAIFDPTSSPLAMAATNRSTNYVIDPSLGLTSAALNAGVRRITANPNFRNRFGPYQELAPFTGEIQVPVLQIKTTGDLFVPIHLEQRYLALTKVAGTSNLLVQRAIRAPGHCNFSTQERTRAFDDLVRWVRHGLKPAGDDLSGDLRDIGRQFTDPIRPGDPGTTSLVPVATLERRAA